MCYSTPVTDLTLTPESGISLCDQAVYAIKRASICGQMEPGEPFPSVRSLSATLKINPNTAHKVVARLTAEGLLEVKPGIGTVVAKDRRRHSLHFNRNFDDKVYSDVLILKRDDGELTTITVDEFSEIRKV